MKRSFARLFEAAPRGLALGGNGGRGGGVAGVTCGRGGENPTETCLVPRNGSGEPARAWSPAWDMVAADPCNGFQPG